MRRGPNMPRGIGLSVPLALLRGHVMVFVPSLLNLGELLITGNGWFVVVRVRLARKFYANIREIEAEFGEAITGLRLVPRRSPVSCELWLYSRYGTLRHFRVDDAGLVEIDCYGIPLDQVRPALTGSPGGRDDASAPSVQVATGPAVPGPADTRTPILRWLAKKNAAGKSTGGSNPETGLDLKRILDAGRPGSKAKRTFNKKPAGTQSDSAMSPGSRNARNGDTPDQGICRDAGEKSAGRRTDATVPEENPDAEGPAGKIPASPRGIVPVPPSPSADGLPGTRESPGEGRDPQVSGSKTGVT